MCLCLRERRRRSSRSSAPRAAWRVPPAASWHGSSAPPNPNTGPPLRLCLAPNPAQRVVHSVPKEVHLRSTRAVASSSRWIQLAARLVGTQVQVVVALGLRVSKCVVRYISQNQNSTHPIATASTSSLSSEGFTFSSRSSPPLPQHAVHCLHPPAKGSPSPAPPRSPRSLGEPQTRQLRHVGWDEPPPRARS